MKRDPELGRVLARALPSGEPRLGAEERVLAQIRRRESSRPPPARAWRAGGGLLAAALLVLAVVAGVGTSLYLGDQPAPREVAAPAALPEAPASKHRLDVGAQDELMILESGVRLLARAHSRAEIVESSAGTECRLERGELLVHVPEGRGQRFEVVTASARALVRGTVFGVSAMAGSSTSVTVWKGRVEVQRGLDRASLGAGQHWPPEAHALTLSESDLRRLRVLERVQAAALDGGAPREGAAPAVSPLGARSLTPPTARSFYRRARDLELGGERRRAAKLYERAAEQGGLSGEAAAFAAARLYVGMEEHALAQRLLLAYRRRHPNGSYARAADVLLLRTYVAQGAAADIEREAERFIRRHPTDPRALQFRWARALQWAKSGRCAEARAELPALGQRYGARLAERCPRVAKNPVDRE